MKVGFIGYGRFAKLREQCLIHSDVLDVEIVGYFDSYCDNEKLKRFSTIESILKKVDAVIISVPPSLAPGYVQLSLKAGKNVFCEKPAAISIDNLHEIDEDLSQNKVLAYGFNHRVHPSVIKMKQVIFLSTMIYI